MDAVVRARRLLLKGARARSRSVVSAVVLASSVLASFVLACGAPPPSEMVGESDKPRGGTSSGASRDAGLPVGKASLPADYRTTFTKVSPSRFVSSGHASGRWDVEVFANEAAVAALRDRAREVPVGAIAVQEHYEREDGAAGPVMMMEKMPKGYAPAHGDWRWLVVGAAGRVAQEGVVASCAGCHDDAPMDGFFPIVPGETPRTGPAS